MCWQKNTADRKNQRHLLDIIKWGRYTLLKLGKTKLINGVLYDL